MNKSLPFALLFLPSVLLAQTPFRMAPGECVWERRTDVTWGQTIRGFSSQWNETTWSAAMAAGRPDVWPRYGDLQGAWAPRSASSPTDWIEIMFPTPLSTAELWVFETNGTGSVYSVSAINPDGSQLALAVSSPERLEQGATMVIVPVEPARVIAGVRVAISSAAADTYGEIDAVAALPSRVCSAGREVTPVASWMRLPPGAAPEPAATGAVWAQEVVRRSSQDSRDRAASQVLGAPNVYPRYGDMPGAWAPSSNDSKMEYVVLRFPPTAAREIHVYETYGVGGVWMVEDMTSGSPVALWADAPTRVGPGEPRVLRIVLPRPRTISSLRVVSSPRGVQSYPMVDAVGLVPAAGAEAK